MIKETVLIEKPLNEVWDFLIMELAKNFKCSPSQLEKKVLETKAESFRGKVTIKQTVSEIRPMEFIEIISENEDTLARKIYELVEDDLGTHLTSGEDGEGKNSILRTWNYKLMSFPVLRNASKKKLRYGLLYIKDTLEGNLEINEGDRE
jgi:hypothetical protein